MGKRSSFERKPRDFYPTPYKGVLPLLPHLKIGQTFCEPMAGDYRLAGHLEKHGLQCVYACDIDPQDERVHKADSLFFGAYLPPCDMIITNPPWERSVLHNSIDTFRAHSDTWLLFDSDWMFTSQAIPFLPYCHFVVSIGRLSWEENGVSGMDNCAWYLFKKEKAINGGPVFSNAA